MDHSVSVAVRDKKAGTIKYVHTSQLSVSYKCDKCMQRIQPHELVHHCVECGDFDLCDLCSKMEKHPHPLYVEVVLQNNPLLLKKKDCVFNSLHNIFLAYHDLPCFGVRAGGDHYQWFSYSQIYERVLNFSKGLCAIGVQPRSFVGICGNNSLEWILADYAAIFQTAIVVPIHTTYDAEIKKFIVKNTDLVCVICGRDYLQSFLGIQDSKLKYIVLLDEKNPLNENIQGVQIFSFSIIEELGVSLEYIAPPIPLPTDLFSIIYTSGSTGMPKGVMVSDGGWNSHLSVLKDSHVSFIFSPLAHSAREAIMVHIAAGNRVAIYQGHISNVYDDLILVRPTILSTVPSFWNKVYQEANQMILSGMDKNDVFEKIWQLFGGRLKSIGTGGAPTSTSVLSFLKQCFKCAVVEGYGTMECGGIFINNKVKQSEVKLVDWGPYSVNDLPFPRGEVCVKKQGMAVGYYKDEKTTEECFVDGWFHTGDIGTLDSEGNLTLIDRKKHIFKLSQGEYVAPEKLENIFLKSNLINQIFIHGDSLRSSVVALVVPSFANLNFSPENVSLQDLNENSDLIRQVTTDIIKIAIGSSLPSYEIPRGILLIPQPFTKENQMLTSSNKLCRHEIIRKYKSFIDQIYGDDDNDPVFVGKSEEVSEEISNEVIEAINNSLQLRDNGKNEKPVDKSSTFIQLGGDSLSSIHLASVIKKKLGVEISMDTLYEESVTIENLIKFVQHEHMTKIGNSVGPSAGYKMGTSKNTPVFIADIINDTIIDEKDFSFNPNQEQKVTSESKKRNNIFLTGATGFLGVYLLQELLTQYNESVIYCLVRSDKNRLKEKLNFHEIWKDEYEERIVVLTGDLEKPFFGWTKEEFHKIANFMDFTYHNAALVNWLFSYTLHRSHNVLGTKEIIKFSLHTPLKILHYISTISVLGRSSRFYEEAELNEDDLSSKGGYAQSKWVAEKLCKNAVNFGLKLNIYRPGTISGDSIKGHSNPSDFINRLLCSLALLKKFPDSEGFLELSPVNYVAKSIVILGKNYSPTENVRHFHLNSPHSISLIEIAQYISFWLGNPIEMVAFGEWVQEIKENPSNPLFPLHSIFLGRLPSFSNMYENVNCEKTTEILRSLGVEFPKVTKELIAIYLTQFSNYKIIPSAEVFEI